MLLIDIGSTMLLIIHFILSLYCEFGQGCYMLFSLCLIYPHLFSFNGWFALQCVTCNVITNLYH